MFARFIFVLFVGISVVRNNEFYVIFDRVIDRGLKTCLIKNRSIDKIVFITKRGICIFNVVNSYRPQFSLFLVNNRVLLNVPLLR